jgi:hypothetical protein
MTHATNECRRSEHAHAGHLLQATDHGVFPRDPRELLINAGDSCLQCADFFDHQPHKLPNHVGERQRGILEQHRDAAHRRARAKTDRQPVFPQQASHRIDASRTVGLPMTSDAMKRQQRLLLEGLHRNWLDVATAHRFK